MMTGLMAACGRVFATLGARATGKGGDIDAALFDTALHNLGYLATWYLNADRNQGREPRGAHPSLVPSQLYPTRDGWIFVMCNKEVFWPVLAEKLGHPEWSDDSRFARFENRLENRDLLNSLLESEFQRRTTGDWLIHLQGAVPCAPVLDVKGALESPFVVDSDRIARFDGPDPLKMLTSPIRVAGAEQPRRAAPALGRDTDDLLAELGYEPDRIAGLRARGIV